MTVIAAMLLLLSRFISLPPHFPGLPVCPKADRFPCSAFSSVIRTGLAAFRAHTEMRSNEPLKHDTPRRDNCCHARIISILSSPVRVA